MAASPLDKSPFAVIYSERTRSELKRLASSASERGQSQAFLAAVTTIDRRLSDDPVGFGDPLHHLGKAKLLVLSRILPPLIVTYAVHETERVVFVRAFIPYPAE